MLAEQASCTWFSTEDALIRPRPTGRWLSPRRSISLGRRSLSYKESPTLSLAAPPRKSTSDRPPKRSKEKGVQKVSSVTLDRVRNQILGHMGGEINSGDDPLGDLPTRATITPCESPPVPDIDTNLSGHLPVGSTRAKMSLQELSCQRWQQSSAWWICPVAHRDLVVHRRLHRSQCRRTDHASANADDLLTGTCPA